MWNPNVHCLPNTFQDKKLATSQSEIIFKFEKMCNPKLKDEARIANVLFLFTTTA